MASYNYPPKYLVSWISAYIFLTHSERQVDTIRFGGNYLADIYYMSDYHEVEVELYHGRRKIGLKRWWADEILYQV